jgi:hypothetical protein
VSEDGQTIPDDKPPAPLERGEILSNIKRWALIGYRQELGGSHEEFEQRWREAFHADVSAADERGQND